MEFNNYMGKFTTSGEVQTAINNGDLLNPYVALVDGEIDWNSKSIDYSKIPLTFEILSGGTITWTSTNSKNITTLEYSKNSGEWVEITSSTSGTPITVSAGDTVQFRGNVSSTRYNMFGDSLAKYKIKGNIMSLLSKNDFTTIRALETDFTFTSLFSPAYYLNNTGLTDASKLVLPATTLALSCYASMFAYCTSLTTAPELPATTLAKRCYNGMFQGCSSLNYIKCLATDISASNCTGNWVSGVASTGTFVKASGTSWTTGVNGIPTGWTVEEI